MVRGHQLQLYTIFEFIAEIEGNDVCAVVYTWFWFLFGDLAAGFGFWTHCKKLCTHSWQCVALPYQRCLPSLDLGWGKCQRHLGISTGSSPARFQRNNYLNTLAQSSKFKVGRCLWLDHICPRRGVRREADDGDNREGYKCHLRQSAKASHL